MSLVNELNINFLSYFFFLCSGSKRVLPISTKGLTGDPTWSVTWRTTMWTIGSGHPSLNVEMPIDSTSRFNSVWETVIYFLELHSHARKPLVSSTTNSMLWPRNHHHGNRRATRSLIELRRMKGDVSPWILTNTMKVRTKVSLPNNDGKF